MSSELSETVRSLVDDPLPAVGTLLPALRPALPYLDLAATRVGRATAALFTDDAGQADLSGSLIRTAIIVAATLLIVGTLIYRALVALGHDTANDIRSAAGWGG
jgi:hypothetical protein